MTLPFPVVFGIVTKGLRIRMGRSIITILGVALGIAFLMSILTSQLIRNGVAKETELRLEISRMTSFLSADCGPVSGRSVALIQAGPLSKVEIRFVRSLKDSGASLKWAAGSSSVAAPEPEIAGLLKVIPAALVAEDATATIIVGSGNAALDFPAILSRARQKILAFSRAQEKIAEIPGATVCSLSCKQTPEELQKAENNARKDKWRNIWIIAISLMVTVIGITNSMLMSVTERFREIGTMKCLGALSSFIRSLFLIESTLVGGAGAVAGSIFGALVPMIMYGFSFGFGQVLYSISWPTLLSYAIFSAVVGMVLSAVAAMYPARFASRMLPSDALRSNV